MFSSGRWPVIAALPQGVSVALRSCVTPPRHHVSVSLYSVSHCLPVCASSLKWGDDQCLQPFKRTTPAAEFSCKANSVFGSISIICSRWHWLTGVFKVQVGFIIGMRLAYWSDLCQICSASDWGFILKGTLNCDRRTLLWVWPPHTMTEAVSQESQTRAPPHPPSSILSWTPPPSV